MPPTHCTKAESMHGSSVTVPSILNNQDVAGPATPPQVLRPDL